MRIATTLLAAAALVVAALGTAAPASAEGPAITTVFVVEVAPAKLNAYMMELKAAQGIIKGLGLPGFSVLQATAAGDATGNLAIVVNSENLTTWAANTTKLQADAGWQAWVAKQQKAGIANILSQNMWVERMPQ
jgi:hypothetical protein